MFPGKERKTWKNKAKSKTESGFYNCKNPFTFMGNDCKIITVDVHSSTVQNITAKNKHKK